MHTYRLSTRVLPQLPIHPCNTYPRLHDLQSHTLATLKNPALTPLPPSAAVLPSQMHFPLRLSLPFLPLLTPTMTASTLPPSSPSSPITRIATFRFRDTVTAAQKGDRTAAFLALYAANRELLLQEPTGGRPLNTPLDLTDVKREDGWDTGFVVVFKVCMRGVGCIHACMHAWI